MPTLKLIEIMKWNPFILRQMKMIILPFDILQEISMSHYFMMEVMNVAWTHSSIRSDIPCQAITT
jgi:hypothetical protein